MAETVRAWRLPPPPPPAVSDLPPGLLAELKGLRLRLGHNLGAGTPERRRMRTAYDEVLVQVADLLELAGAPEPDLVIGRRILTFPERAMLEKAVMAAGVDLGVEHRSPCGRSAPAPTHRGRRARPPHLHLRPHRLGPGGPS